jgi:hypothetical protein
MRANTFGNRDSHSRTNVARHKSGCDPVTARARNAVQTKQFCVLSTTGVAHQLRL